MEGVGRCTSICRTCLVPPNSHDPSGFPCTPLGLLGGFMVQSSPMGKAFRIMQRQPRRQNIGHWRGGSAAEHAHFPVFGISSELREGGGACVNGGLCYLGMLFLLMGIKPSLCVSLCFSSCSNVAGGIRLYWCAAFLLLDWFCLHTCCNQVHEKLSLRVPLVTSPDWK